MNKESVAILTPGGGDGWHCRFVEGEVLGEDEVTKVDGKPATPGVEVIKLFVFVANAAAK